MIHFDYSKGYPENSELQEMGIRKKYKEVVEKYPDTDIYFNWMGHEWSITAPDPVLIRMNELDNENKP